jgi:hypothetical protein
MIRNREHMRSIVNFDNMYFDKICPIDLDAFMEFNNKLFIFIETKYMNAPMPLGQQLALERICDTCHMAGKKSILMVTSHNDNDEIDLGNSTVTKYRWNMKWRTPLNNIKLYDAVLKMKEKYI